MKKNRKWQDNKISILISITIVIGFIISSVLTYFNYGRVIEEDIKNISKLTSTSIYAEINQELLKPLFVSLTMANDSFLKNWLEEEKIGTSDLDELKGYLSGIRDKYHYSSVFLVSSDKLNYYHYKGIHKVVTPEDDHDQWYYRFLALDKPYDVVIDVDQAANNRLTAFVNCRVVDAQQNLLGVTGVGLNVDEIQNILHRFDDTYHLEVFLMDSDGVIQAHTNSAMILTHNANEDPAIQAHFDNLLLNNEKMQTYRYAKEGENGYLISHYIDDLDWYLMVKKDTAVLRQSFFKQLLTELTLAILVIVCVLLLSNTIIRRNHKEIQKIMKTDQLTKLLNRRGFDEISRSLLEGKETSVTDFSVFLFDIDRFKRINDKYGHLFGDSIIAKVAETVRPIVPENGILARWGGDEFAGIIYGDTAEAEVCVKQMIEAIAHSEDLKALDITISAGIASRRAMNAIDDILVRADMALYQSKRNGKNQLTVL